MKVENYYFSAKAVELAEHDNYLELVNRLCYYDDKNLNSVQLPYHGVEDRALELAKTLVNMPVQAKYKKINNLDDLDIHEMSKDRNGNVVFDTASIGTHTEVYIQNDTVTTVSGETKELPCLYAKCRVWKRHENFISAIKRLFDSPNGLNTSWEIGTSAYMYDKGVKVLTDYEFLANTFLGSNVTPAYNGTSQTISLSSLEDSELMIAEALMKDLTERNEIYDNKEEENLKKEGIASIAETEVVESVEEKVESTIEVPISEIDNEATPEENKEQKVESTTDNQVNVETKVDTSDLTTFDLRQALLKACKEKIKTWCWVSFVFPEEHYVLCEKEEGNEMDYLKFTYSVDANDNVIVSEPEEVTLVATPKNINTVIADFEKTIAEKDELIIKASAEINELKALNTELSQYKYRLDEIEQERVAAELQAKKEELIASVVNSGQITREEIETSEELSAYVENLDKKSLMALVGERLSASLAEKQVEVSTVKNETIVSTNLHTDDEVEDRVSVMRNFLKK